MARIFADLLEKAGARAGHKFIEMTASHALRIGSEKFATELAQLTGGRQGIGPSASRFLKNTSVEVDDIDHNKSAGSRTPPKRYPGKIVKVQSNGQFTVEYTDGKVEEDVDKARIHPLGVEATVGGVLFLDEAYDLDPKSNDTGRSILAEIMSVAEDHRDKVTALASTYSDLIGNVDTRSSAMVYAGDDHLGWLPRRH